MMSPVPSRSGTGKVVTVIGLMLVWGLVWAHLPSRADVRFMPAKRGVAIVSSVSDIDLSIPGVTPSSVRSSETVPGPSSSTADNDGPSPRGNGQLSSPHARQVAEVKCEAEVQRICPEALIGEAGGQCIEPRLRQLSPVCRQIARQRIVRWKDAEGYKLACLDEVQRLCPTVQPGEGRILQCLQNHAQGLSDRCHESLPKGHLLVRQ